MPKIAVRHSVQVSKPPNYVFEYISDPEKMPEWQAISFDAKGQQHRGPLKKGEKAEHHGNIFGKKLDVEWEMADSEQDKRLVLAITKGPIDWKVTFTLQPNANGTLLTGEGGGDLGKLALPDQEVQTAAQRMFENDLETLAKVLS